MPSNWIIGHATRLSLPKEGNFWQLRAILAIYGTRKSCYVLFSDARAVIHGVKNSALMGHPMNINRFQNLVTVMSSADHAFRIRSSR
jgi:hypothetical protein